VINILMKFTVMALILEVTPLDTVTFTFFAPRTPGAKAHRAGGRISRVKEIHRHKAQDSTTAPSTQARFK